MYISMYISMYFIMYSYLKRLLKIRPHVMDAILFMFRHHL